MPKNKHPTEYTVNRFIIYLQWHTKEFRYIKDYDWKLLIFNKFFNKFMLKKNTMWWVKTHK